MQRGGKRDGAGRKPGSANRRTREIADQAAAEGLTPLEIMLRTMRQHASADRWDEAAAVAKDAAPYMHPRLASVDMSATMDIRHEVRGEPLTVEEWEAKYCEARH